MNQWRHTYKECGTISCIGGTAELIGNVNFGVRTMPEKLWALFYPRAAGPDWDRITPAQAATALRSYLTTGSAHWELAVK